MTDAKLDAPLNRNEIGHAFALWQVAKRHVEAGRDYADPDVQRDVVVVLRLYKLGIQGEATAERMERYRRRKAEKSARNAV